MFRGDTGEMIDPLFTGLVMEQPNALSTTLIGSRPRWLALENPTLEDRTGWI